MVDSKDDSKANAPNTGSETRQLAEQDLESRFDRQILHWGPEVQRKVSESCISVIVDDGKQGGYLGKYIASYLASAGFGNIRFVGKRILPEDEKFFWGFPLNATGKTNAETTYTYTTIASAYTHVLPQLSPHIDALAITSAMDNAFVADQLRRSDVIIDATNSICSKVWTLYAARKYSIPAISASCYGLSARIQVYDPKDDARYNSMEERSSFFMEEFDGGMSQDELVAMAWAGVVDEEAKKLVIRDVSNAGNESSDKNIPLRGTLSYVFRQRPSPDHFNGMHVLAIGAGASACIGIYALAKMGFNVITLDNDTIQSTNLARVPWFIGREGESKALVMEEVVNLALGRNAVRGIKAEFDSKFSMEHTPEFSLVASFVDNDYARGEAYEFALARKLPLLHVETAFDGFNSAFSVPGKTSCLYHYYPGLDEQAKTSLAMIRAGCLQTVPSNSWMQSGAAFAVLEVPSAFFPDVSGEPSNGSLYYDANMDARIKSMKSRKICECYTNGRYTT